MRRSSNWKHWQSFPQASPMARSVSIRFGIRCAAIGALKKLSPHSRRKNGKAQPRCFTESSHARNKIYNLSSGALGVGTYRVDITINGTVVGNAIFQLK